MLESYINNNKIKENKYKILRMSLILDSSADREETLASFEESAREIDAMNDETYLKEIEDKFYDTLKLEEEEQKLAVLVDYIGGRVEQRISLLSDFANITGYDLTGLPPIKYYDKLDDYKERLKYVREYLSNIELINKLTLEIEESEEKLKEAYTTKETSEEYNKQNEETLFEKFTNLVKSLPQFKNVTIENIDEKINNIISNVEESKKSLDIFAKSYSTLKGSGISYDEENEYKSYVDNAKEVYYDNKEQEYLLRIYKLLFNKEIEYSNLVIKREAINEILYDRMELRNQLEISSTDILNPLYEQLERQYKEIVQQKNTIDTIEYLTKLIEIKKEEKDSLDLANQKVEILSLLREFCLIDAYEGLEETTGTPDYEEPLYNELDANITPEEISTSLENELSQEETEEIILPNDIFIPNQESAETSSEGSSSQSFKDNQVISIEDASMLDIALIQSKATKVMKRVGEMLGIKIEESTLVTITNDDKINENKIEEIQIEPVEINPFLETTPEVEMPAIQEFPETTESVAESENFEFKLPNNPLPAENPLFSTNTEASSVDPEDDNNFWFPSDMPDALNDLPDLEVPSDNFFGNGDIPDLNFPDLKIDFGTDTEAQ